MMSSPPQPNQATSPFDPFLAPFLREVARLDTGFSPTAHGPAIADQLGVEVAFVEALATSARRRRLIEPFYAPAHRNSMRWRISGRGTAFLAEHIEVADPE